MSARGAARYRRPASAGGPAPSHRQVEYDARGRAVRVIETDAGGQRHVLRVERDEHGRLAGLRPAEDEPPVPEASQPGDGAS